ncbi:MAG: type II toxin-antitoxin system VapC family toxin [Capsulimonadales bacterium]|nr:type II toxin-antitoxin system VapC family toxin [Capsulimonadales bacterium]
MVSVTPTISIPAPLHLADTNILVHYLRMDATGQVIRSKYDLLMATTKPVLSVVTEGEILSLAYQFGWGTKRVDQMRYLLAYFGRAPIDTPAMLEAYALIDSYSERIGRTMGKNDVWIAATAHVTGAVLLTTDNDFDHLMPLFLTRESV